MLWRRDHLYAEYAELEFKPVCLERAGRMTSCLPAVFVNPADRSVFTIPRHELFFFSRDRDLLPLVAKKRIVLSVDPVAPVSYSATTVADGEAAVNPESVTPDPNMSTLRAKANVQALDELEEMLLIRRNVSPRTRVVVWHTFVLHLG